MTKNAAFTATAGVGLLAMLGGTAATQPGGTLVAAHRGGALLWPENSLLAFRNAIALGVDFLELDVHLSRDGGVVVIHDPTLERTTTGTGAVRDLTAAEIAELRLRGNDGKTTGEKVPTLEEVVALAASARLRLLLEIKVDARGERYPGIEEKVLGILDSHGMAGRTIVMAFEDETVRTVRQLRPDVIAGRLFSPRSLERMLSTVEQEIEALKKAGARFVGLHQKLVTAEVVEQAGKGRLLLGVWTVNEADAMKQFVALGVGVLVTDRPDVARELLPR